MAEAQPCHQSNLVNSQPDTGGDTSGGFRRSVDEWRSLVMTYRTPLTRCIHPLKVLLKTRLYCDSDQGQALKEEFLQLPDMEAAGKLLDFLLQEDGQTEDHQLARWSLFGDALKAIHPVLHEIIIGHGSLEIQEQQKMLIDFFMEDIADCVDPQHLLGSLYAQKVLCVEDCEKLRCYREQKGPTMAAIFMVCNIHRQHPDWYTTFLGILMDNHYQELVAKLDADAYKKLLEQRASKSSLLGPRVGDDSRVNILRGSGDAHVSQAANYAGAPPLSKEEERQQDEDSPPQPVDRSERTAAVLDSYACRSCNNQDGEEYLSCTSSLDSEDDSELTEVKKAMTSAYVEDMPRERVYSDGNSLDRERMLQAGPVMQEPNIRHSQASELTSNTDNVSTAAEQEEEGEEDEEPQPLVLRDYQDELARRGLEGNNVIIVAPTGSGKTLVSVRIIQNHLEQPGSGVRKVVFLVNQLALAQQQYDYCHKYLSNFRIKLVLGNAAANINDKVPIKHLLMRADVLVMTAQILVNALEQKEIDGICQFSLIVFDECHHTKLGHPFNMIMHHYMKVKYDDSLVEELQQLPQVVGLTASVGVGKAENQEDARKHIMKLCAHLDADHLCSVRHHTKQLAQYSNDPKYEQQICNKRPEDKFQETVDDTIMKAIEDKIEASQYTKTDDAKSLKEKLKVKPHVRGTVQYTGWVCELMRDIAMLKDATARRYLESARRMLKFYNDSLAINDECETEDAVKYLEKQFLELPGFAMPDTEMERFLKELFDKNRPFFDAMSKEQANTNPKLIVLENMLVEAFKEKSESRAIVFVKTRDLAEALHHWMHRRPNLKRLRPGKMVGAGPSFDRGGMTKTQQVDVMEFFRQGDHKVLIATSVAEEGLDIRQCNLVIRYNHVTNEIAMVQARGRAREENSQFVTLASRDQGVQAKEEINLIREMMMHQAIKQLQEQMHNDPHRIRRAIQQIQQDEKKKRDAELAQRQGRHLRQGEVIFRCRKCDAYGFISSDVKKIDHIHHVVVDLTYKDRHTERLRPATEHGRIQVRGKVLCKECGEDWGSVLQYQNCKFPVIKLEGFRITDEFDRVDIPKKWNKASFIVQDLEPEELERYRQDAIAENYVF